MTQPVSRPAPGPRIHQVRREVDACSPVALLCAGEGGARGFWALGDRWIAHAGVVREIAIRRRAGNAEPDSGVSAEDGGAAQGTTGPCRFRAVQDQAAALFGRVGDGGRSRVFGGFAFAPRQNGDRMWASFPPALFHLPKPSWSTIRSRGSARWSCVHWTSARRGADGRRGPRPWAPGSRRLAPCVGVGVGVAPGPGRAWPSPSWSVPSGTGWFRRRFAGSGPARPRKSCSHGRWR